GESRNRVADHLRGFAEIEIETEITVIRHSSLRSSRRLRFRETQFLARFFAHQIFLDLAGHRHRETVDKLNIARNLVMRDLALAELSDFLIRAGLARF